MNTNKALVVANPVSDEEARKERFAQLIVFGKDGDDYQGLTVAQAGKAMRLTPRQAKEWWASVEVQTNVRTMLDAIRQGTEIAISKEVQLAIQTLHNAMASPEYKKHQVDAAKAILSYHLRQKAGEEPTVALQVVVNTASNDGAIEAQARRVARRQEREAAEADFTVLE